MTKHNYLTVEKLEELGNELVGIKKDLEILRAFSEGFKNPEKITKDEVFFSYIRAHKFFDLFFDKAQDLENQLDDAAEILLEAGNYETLKEHLSVDKMELRENNIQ